MIRTYRFEASALDPSRREALAYLRVREADAETNTLLSAAFREAKSLCDCRCRAGVFEVDFAGAVDPALPAKLVKCHRFVLFCATLGHEIDRRIARYAAAAPVKAAMLDAAAGALVESLCDKLTATLEKELGPVTLEKRFSPGYGDLPLSAQQRVFDLLELSRIGVGLGSSMLLSPAKTVTAVIGIKSPEGSIV